MPFFLPSKLHAAVAMVSGSRASPALEYVSRGEDFTIEGGFGRGRYFSMSRERGLYSYYLEGCRVSREEYDAAGAPHCGVNIGF